MMKPQQKPAARIGIFRRIAVQRYSQPLEIDTPEMLAPRRPGLLALGVVLACSAALLLAAL